MRESLGLSYSNSRELNTIIDKLPGRPEFVKSEITVDGEKFDVYHRDILECIKSLIGDPEFADKLKLVPERHFSDKDHQNRVYGDIHTGKWWWKVQVCINVLDSEKWLTPLNRLRWKRRIQEQQLFQYSSHLTRRN